MAVDNCFRNLPCFHRNPSQAWTLNWDTDSILHSHGIWKFLFCDSATTEPGGRNSGEIIGISKTFPGSAHDMDTHYGVCIFSVLQSCIFFLRKSWLQWDLGTLPHAEVNDFHEHILSFTGLSPSVFVGILCPWAIVDINSESVARNDLSCTYLLCS